ncbi:MAG TPA: hypothetical protein DCZ41_04535 [Firmicutes bacterium]|nr:hypothetical protein [Bacillota bacterium]
MDESGKDGEEEERRLAYVAFTRAKKKLFVSCNSGYSFATDSSATPSMFFKEAGLSLPVGEGYYSRPSWKPSFAYGKKNDDSFFNDGKAFDPFEDEKKAPNKPQETYTKPLTNGITDWMVGDRVHHEKFGEGDVVGVPDKNIIVVNFDTCGKKTLLSTHPMITRIHRKGGVA